MSDDPGNRAWDVEFDTSRPFFYENGYFLTAPADRIRKLIVHHEFFRRSVDVPGDIVECGVFKGASFARFLKFRGMYGQDDAKKAYGFDIFGTFPAPPGRQRERDGGLRDNFVKTAGAESIAPELLLKFLDATGSNANVEFVAGDVCVTVPRFLRERPDLRISFINLDVDYYEPTLTCLSAFWNHISPGGIVVIDDYNDFAGATEAVDEFVKDKSAVVESYLGDKCPYAVRKP